MALQAGNHQRHCSRLTAVLYHQLSYQISLNASGYSRVTIASLPPVNHTTVTTHVYASSLCPTCTLWATVSLYLARPLHASALLDSRVAEAPVLNRRLVTCSDVGHCITQGRRCGG
jgi:hypothetical protein